MGFSQSWGYLFEGPYDKAYNNWGSISGSSYLGKVPNTAVDKHLFRCVHLKSSISLGTLRADGQRMSRCQAMGRVVCISYRGLGLRVRTLEPDFLQKLG